MSIASISLVPKVVVQELESINGIQLSSLTNSAFLGTDAQGNIVDVSGGNTNYNGKIDDGNVISGNNGSVNYLSGIINNCLTSVDFTSRVCHVWVNVGAKNNSGANGLSNTIEQSPATTLALIQIETDAPANGQIPPPNSDNLSGYFQGVYFNTDTPANNTQVPFYWVWNNAQIYIYIFQNSALTVGANDDIQFQGYFTYLF
jgi:hypothetical protein